MRDLVQQLIKALEQDRELIVCQVVETRGSTPQKAGSMMIIDPDGGQAGTLGGGCVENEVKQKAIQQIGGESAAVHSFVLDHDYAWADGLICGGKMVILTPGRAGYRVHWTISATLDRVIAEGRGFTEAIVVDGKQAGGASPGTPLLVRRRQRAAGELAGRAVARGLVGRLVPPAERPKPSVHGGVAFLPNWPRIRLIVVGAGHVGQAVASLAAQADFDVWVVDDRHQYANRDRFPAAQRAAGRPDRRGARDARDHSPRRMP